jgi:hypothetical protein
MKQSETNLSQNLVDNYVCELCDYNTYRKYDYEKHTLTQKHKMKQCETKCNKNVSKTATPKTHHKCTNCNNYFNCRTTLWRHKKTCNKPLLETNINPIDLVNFLMKDNTEFKQFMIEQNKQMLEQNKQIIEMSKISGNNNNNTTNNNQSFNINVYLNETCKNAMNIMEFVDQLKIDNNDLEETGRLGYANGISRIIINGLNNLNVSDRPIHCSDGKRETIYIKDNNVWNKETTDKNILTNAVKCINKKNIKQIFEWTKCNPEYKNSSSKVNDRYLKIVSESMSGSTIEETNKNYEKIIRNVANATVIDKMSTIC